MIENEFGAVGIDDGLLKKNMKEKTEDEVIEMLNGCVCCTVREVQLRTVFGLRASRPESPPLIGQDLIQVLKKLVKRMQGGNLKLDALVIETTGRS